MNSKNIVLLYLLILLACIRFVIIFFCANYIMLHMAGPENGLHTLQLKFLKRCCVLCSHQLTLNMQYILTYNCRYRQVRVELYCFTGFWRNWSPGPEASPGISAEVVVTGRALVHGRDLQGGEGTLRGTIQRPRLHPKRPVWETSPPSVCCDERVLYHGAEQKRNFSCRLH